MAPGWRGLSHADRLATSFIEQSKQLGATPLAMVHAVAIVLQSIEDASPFDRAEVAATLESQWAIVAGAPRFDEHLTPKDKQS